MQMIIILVLAVILFEGESGELLRIEQHTFESRVKNAETILFGRFNWAVPVSNGDDLRIVHTTKQNTFEFIVYCTIKKSKTPDNVPHVIRITIEHNETQVDMQKNNWFILFPTKSNVKNVWKIENRSAAFDLEDDVELRLFEQFCFLKPKLPIGFPSNGLLNRCPKPSAEHCLKNGTRIRPDELLELKLFLTSTTTRRTTTKKKQLPIVRQRRLIEPVW